MNKMIFFLINTVLFLFLSAGSIFAQESKFYHINLLYDKGKIELKNIAVLPGEISQVPQEGEYMAELISLSGTSLYNDHFQVPLSIHGEDIDPKTGQFTSKTIKTDNTQIILNIPYFPTGEMINIYDSQNTKILDIPVIGFAKVTPTPSKSPETSVLDKPNAKIFLILVVGGIVAFALISFFIYLKFKKSQSPAQ